MRFLSLQSHVAYGYVGNRAATFPLQRLGHEVWAVNTVEFSNHTGYGAWRGRTASAEQVADIVHGIEALGLLAKCDALLTGYVGDAALGDVVLDTARKVRAANPRAIWCCDPVLGDIDTGIYVKPGIDTFFKDRALPRGRPDHAQPFRAGAPDRPQGRDHWRGARSGAQPAERPAARPGHQPAPRRCATPSRSRCWRSRRDAAWRIVTPLIGFEIMPNGTGDTVAALFTAHWLESGDIGSALGLAASSIYAVLEATQRWASANCSSSPRRTAWFRRLDASCPRDYSGAMHVPGFAFNPIMLSSRERSSAS